MKVISVHVSNLLSFDEFELCFDDGLTVLVGPNGSGKTNVVRVLDLVSKLVDWADERSRSSPAAPTPAEAVLSSYVQAVHSDSPVDSPIKVDIRIDFTTPSERERIVAFVRAAMLATLAQDSSQARHEPMKSLLCSWLQAEVNDSKLSSLFSGTLAFEHPGYEGAAWEARYEFEHDNRRFDWILHSPTMSDSIVPHGQAPGAGDSTISIWEALFGKPAGTSPPPSLPDPLPRFHFGVLCPPAGRALANLGIRTGTGVFNDQHEAFRTAARLLSFTPSMAGQQEYGLARVIKICITEGLVILGEQFRGLGVGGTIPWRAGIYPWESLAAPVPPRDPGFLPLRLFQLKNSPAFQDRATFSVIQEQFSRLAHGRCFDVTFTAVSMPVPVTMPVGAGQVAVANAAGESGSQGQPGGIVSVVAWDRTGEGEPRQERPLQLFGAGTWEALVMAEALVTSADRLTVLDEPAVTMHPTWQTTLRSELRGRGGQLLLVTHSPSLVPMDTGEDLRRLVRMVRATGASRCCRLPASLTAQDTAKMARTFALSADARALLFCRGAVIVSGETELGALPIWFSKASTAQTLGTPSELDLAFFSVAGDGGFANVLWLLHALKIPWTLLCDGKSFDIATNWGSHVFRQITRSGIDIAGLADFTRRVNDGGKAQRTMTKELWGEQLKLGAQHGIFTLTTSWEGPEEGIESFFERVVPGKLLEAEAAVGKGSKIRQGRWVAQETACPEQVADIYRQIINSLERRSKELT
jgi:AAA ATPase-like protein/putative AbiEii toxin of type IV toxin-antitoxin system/OLD-like protein